MVTMTKDRSGPPASARRGRRGSPARWLNNIFLALCAYATLFPFVNVIATSLSSSRAINAGEVFMWPIEFNLDAYHNLIRDGQLIVAMQNTVLITVIGTALNMLFTIMAAYPLSKARLKGRGFMLMAILFTMLFSGGLIELSAREQPRTYQYVLGALAARFDQRLQHVRDEGVSGRAPGGA